MKATAWSFANVEREKSNYFGVNGYRNILDVDIS